MTHSALTSWRLFLLLHSVLCLLRFLCPAVHASVLATSGLPVPIFCIVSIVDSSSFLHAENLIGSIHRHAPLHRLLLYDAGLTAEQRVMLAAYDKVQLQPPPLPHHRDRYVLLPQALLNAQQTAVICRCIVFLDPTLELTSYPNVFDSFLRQQTYLFTAEPEAVSSSSSSSSSGGNGGGNTAAVALSRQQLRVSSLVLAYDAASDLSIGGVMLAAAACMTAPAACSVLQSNSSQRDNRTRLELTLTALVLRAELRIEQPDVGVWAAHVIARAAPQFDPAAAAVSHEADGQAVMRRQSAFFPYVDAARKRLKLAVVVPFIPSQQEAVLSQLQASVVQVGCWQQLSSRSTERAPEPIIDPALAALYVPPVLFPPALGDPLDVRPSVDLLLYSNGGLNASASAAFLSQVHAAVNASQLSECFGSVRLMSAALSAAEDEYPFGIGFMWQRLFIHPQLSLRHQGYSHFLFMEPDTRPLRRFWIHALLSDIQQQRAASVNASAQYAATDWWMKGSVYRGQRDFGLYLTHINGNALYHLSSAFLSYLQLVWQRFPFALDRSERFDMDIFAFIAGSPQEMRSHSWWERADDRAANRRQLAAAVIHKLRFTETLQNCWATGSQSSRIAPSPTLRLTQPQTLTMTRLCCLCYSPCQLRFGRGAAPVVTQQLPRARQRCVQWRQRDDGEEEQRRVGELAGRPAVAACDAAVCRSHRRGSRAPAVSAMQTLPASADSFLSRRVGQEMQRVAAVSRVQPCIINDQLSGRLTSSNQTDRPRKMRIRMGVSVVHHRRGADDCDGKGCHRQRIGGNRSAIATHGKAIASHRR